MKTQDLIIIIGAMLIFYAMTLIGLSRTAETVITAINDSGKATDYKLKEIVQRIDNYNLNSFKVDK